MMRWAEARFVHRVHDGPPPARPLRTGPRARHELVQWLRYLLAWCTGIAVGGLFTLLAWLEAARPAPAPSECGRWCSSSTSRSR